MHFWVLFFCRRGSRDNFPRNYWAIKETCSLCLYGQSDLCKSYDIVSTMIKLIYIAYIYIVNCTWMSERLSFTHPQVFFGVTSFTEQSNSSSNFLEAKGGRHVGEADLPPSCCEADLRWWSLAGGLQCYDTSASDGAIGTWRRLGWTNDEPMIPSHSIWYIYIYMFLYDDSRWTKPALNLFTNYKWR